MKINDKYIIATLSCGEILCLIFFIIFQTFTGITNTDGDKKNIFKSYIKNTIVILYNE